MERRIKLRARASRPRWRKLYEAYETFGSAQLYRSMAVDDQALERGLDDERLTVDRRFQRFFRGEAVEPVEGERAAVHEAMIHTLQRDRYNHLRAFRRATRRVERLAAHNRALQRRTKKLEREQAGLNRRQAKLRDQVQQLQREVRHRPLSRLLGLARRGVCRRNR